MKIIAGLGNPGPKYETTRHNVGWLALDRLIEDWKATGPQTKHQGMVWTADVGGEKVLLIKPLTYMNLSGQAIAPHYTFHKLSPTDLIVLHDEMDIAAITMRLKTGGGAGGHNGLKSIDASIGGGQTGYHRVRIGVGHPRMINSPMDPADYVLGQFRDEELRALDPLLDEVKGACEMLVRGEATKAMNKFNQKN